MTSTPSFGSSKRESHDASAFYERFAAPEIDPDDTINPPTITDALLAGDARNLSIIPDNSVALVVTSPPYWAGKDYEQAIGKGGVPNDYLDYLLMLRDVFAECRRVLEPGGRIAVNVANLGRKPYRSLAGDVLRILQDDLSLLPRGEIVWLKGRGASGSCAWGSFCKPSNPTLRDLTERIVIASKGRFDRAIPAKTRRENGLPWEATITKEQFMSSTLDVWEIRPASAKRLGHPAPFPVDLPARLIQLYTYRGDVVLDPFAGVCTTALAAAAADRRYLCVDLDEAYLDRGASRLKGMGATPQRIRLDPLDKAS